MFKRYLVGGRGSVLCNIRHSRLHTYTTECSREYLLTVSCVDLYVYYVCLEDGVFVCSAPEEYERTSLLFDDGHPIRR